MKTRPIAFLLLLASFALGGCATTTTPGAAKIVRFVPVSAPVVEAVATDAAKAHGYTQMKDGRWQWALFGKKDPVVGLIPVEGEASFSIRFSMLFEAVNDAATRIVVEPVIATKKFGSDDFNEKPLGPGYGGRPEIIAMLDNAVAEAQSIAAGKK